MCDCATGIEVFLVYTVSGYCVGLLKTLGSTDSTSVCFASPDLALLSENSCMSGLMMTLGYRSIYSIVSVCAARDSLHSAYIRPHEDAGIDTYLQSKLRVDMSEDT